MCDTIRKKKEQRAYNQQWQLQDIVNYMITFLPEHYEKDTKREYFLS